MMLAYNNRQAWPEEAESNFWHIGGANNTRNTVPDSYVPMLSDLDRQPQFPR